MGEIALKGYETEYGYMGLTLSGHRMLFESEQAYVDYRKEEEQLAEEPKKAVA